jgi:hypothetical protein
VAITALKLQRSFSQTLGQQRVKILLRHDQKAVATLCLGLDGDRARVVRAGVCVSYGNGAFARGGQRRARCESGPGLVQAVRWQGDGADPMIEFNWSGALGMPDDVPARIASSSARIARR